MTKYNLEEFKKWLIEKNKVYDYNINNQDWLDFYKLIQKIEWDTTKITANDKNNSHGHCFKNSHHRRFAEEWITEMGKLDKQKDGERLRELSNLLFPNHPYNFTQLKQEISRLKYQELAPQVRNEKEKLEQLMNDTKNKAGENFVNIVDLLLQTQKKVNESKQESNEYYLIKGQLIAYQTLLQTKLGVEEIQNLLTKQTELQQLERHLASLQINEQQPQIIQPTNLPPKS